MSESQHFEHLHVINDFEAVGHAVGALRAGDLNPIGSQRLALPMNQGVCAIVGVGTGLGVGGVIANAGAFTVLATEGGHASFAPTNERAIELLRWLRRKYGRVSAERVLSGAGLANVYLALCEVEGLHVAELSAAEITTRAANGSDANCVEAVGLFCELLGSFAGDLALTLGAWQGVLISGAMLQHFDRADARAPRARRVRIQGALHARHAQCAGRDHFPSARRIARRRAAAVQLMKHPIQKFVLFGATGDLSQRMVWPSLYHLCREKLVPPTLTFVGSARNPMPNDEFRKFVEGALRKHVPAEYLKEDAVADLLTRITYVPFEAGDGSAKGTEALQKALAGNNRILYFMATSPKFYGPTCLSLAAAGLACEHCRVVLEKPIGHGLRLERRDQRGRGPGVPRRPHLPHRPLPRQRGGAEPARAALRELAVRAAVERIDHRQRADHRRGNRRPRRPHGATTTIPARCATWCRTTCCSSSRWSRWSRRTCSSRTKCATRRPR